MVSVAEEVDFNIAVEVVAVDVELVETEVEVWEVGGC